MSATGEVTVKVTVESLGKAVWQKEYSALSGSPDIGLDFDVKINADVEIIGEMVRKQEALVGALKELLSGQTIEGLRGHTGLMDLCVTGEDVRAGLEALAAVESPSTRANTIEELRTPAQHEPDADGWIEWNEGCFGFGECPVSDDNLVEVKLEGGDIFGGCRPSLWDWSSNNDPGCNIVAYRVLPSEATK